ncbi:MAG: S-adenosylmethionine:tRNA ribosyltransferase-isomerase, partial [Gemmatimonadales bacterium]
MSERRWTAADFDYPLPHDLIAQFPSSVRGESRLLAVESDRDPSTARDLRSRSAQDDDVFRDLRFCDLAGMIPPGDLLVLNATRVRHARLIGRRPNGAPAEVLLVHPASGDEWIALGSPGR